jgi:AraC-like DNA-binding protein
MRGNGGEESTSRLPVKPTDPTVARSHDSAVETLAAMADLSRSQYALHFRELTGRSPKSHLMRLRIHRATQLLDTTSDSITHIARGVGYEDPLYFSRAFRQMHELSPSRYRDARRRGLLP